MKTTPLATAALLFIISLGLLVSCTKPAKVGMGLARDGSARCVIVATPEEKVAADELKSHLNKITGGDFAIVEEKAFSGDGPAIYLGETAFARKHGIEFSTFAPEEWLIKTVGGNLIVAGSKINGTLFGVYDLLESQLGCHWFSPESTHIPKNPNASLPNLDIRKTPSFAERIIDSNVTQPRDKRYPEMFVDDKTFSAFQLFEQRIRSHQLLRSPLSISKQYLFCHNFYDFVSPEKYFKTHPEYFSMNEKGERFHGVLGELCMNEKGERYPGRAGQLCLSNPAVWEATLDSLRGFIKKDRESLPPEQWPTVYDISQMDSSDYICKCPQCAMIIEQEGEESGLLLTYINHVAREIAKEYPEIQIRTFAYTHTEKAPKTLRPEPNVIIRWCDLFTRSDCYRPFTSSFNAKRKEQLEGWSATGAHIALWDYWNMGYHHNNHWKPPRVETMVDAIAPDLRYFKGAGVVSYFTQMETFPDGNPQNFGDLQVWLGYQLLLDLNRDPEPLIALYMDKQYGPAAGPMSKFLNILREAIRAEKAPLFYIENPARPNTANQEFLSQAYQLLTEARDLTAPGSDYRKRVEKEMITPLAVILRNPRLKIGDRKAMLAFYTEWRNAQIRLYYPPDVQAKLKAKLAVDLQDFDAPDIPTPPLFSQVAENDIRKFAYPDLTDEKGSKQFIVDDPDSPVGKAMTAPPRRKHDMTTPFSGLFPTHFGVYEPSTKKGINFDVPKIPTDEKYHWYKVGVFDVGPGTYVHGFIWVMRADISGVYANPDGLADFNKWEVWISAKYTGPAYVAGSTKPNQVFWDQVVLVRPGSVRD